MKFAIVDMKGDIEVRETDKLSVQDARDIVGEGDVEQMPSPPNIVVLALGDSSDGYNWSATRLCQQYLMPTDRIFGTAIVTGPADHDGDPTDVPDSVVGTLLEWHEHRK